MPYLCLMLILLGTMHAACAQTPGEQTPPDNLDGLWNKADTLEKGADQSNPGFVEAQKLLDRAAATADPKEASRLLRQACKALRRVQKGDKADPLQHPGDMAGDGDAPPGDRDPTPKRRPGGNDLRPGGDRSRADRPGADRPHGDRNRDGGHPRFDRTRPSGDQLARFLQTLDPDVAQQIRELQQQAGPQLGERLRRLMMLHRTSPDLARLELDDMLLNHRSETLARQIRNQPFEPTADSAEDSREARLRTMITRLFDLRMKKHEQEIALEEQELKDLQRMLQEDRQLLLDRQQARANLIDERINRLLRRPATRDW